MNGIGPSPILRYFTHAHLRPELSAISEQFAALADWIELHLPASAEKTTALRKLLESKDAAVRAGLDGMRAMTTAHPLDSEDRSARGDGGWSTRVVADDGR